MEPFGARLRGGFAMALLSLSLAPAAAPSASRRSVRQRATAETCKAHPALVQGGVPEAPEQRDGIDASEVSISQTAGSMPDGWRGAPRGLECRGMCEVIDLVVG